MARRASSPVRTPLITTGPRQQSRIQRRSAHVTAERASAALISTSGMGPLPGMTTLGSAGRPPSSKKLMSQPGRENISSASLAGGPSRRHFAARVHKTAVSDRTKQEEKGKVETQHAGTQIALRDRDCMARSECHILKRAAILAKRYLAFRAAVQIVKHGFRHPATRQRSQILDANDTGGCYLAGRPRHR